MLRAVLQTLGKHHCIIFGFIWHCIIMFSSEAIFSDAWLMAGGYFLMFGYTIAMLGRWNRVEVSLKMIILCDKEPAWWFWWQASRSKGCPEPPKRMNFRKNSDGRGGHFQSKNLYYKIWTFKQGYLNMKLIQRGLFRLCFSTIVLIKIKTRYIFKKAVICPLASQVKLIPCPLIFIHK